MFSKKVEVHVIAGQSNAQGIQGDAAHYPTDSQKLDTQIPFCYNAIGFGNSDAQWQTLGPQIGRFPAGHFGLEVSFGRTLKRLRIPICLFKFTMPSSSLQDEWKGPGENGIYDQMHRELQLALANLRQRRTKPRVCSFTWIQGESDAKTDESASQYERRLSILVNDVRRRLKEPNMPIVLGIDEQHPWVAQRPIVIDAQLKIVSRNARMKFLSMEGLEKVDASHLSPAGLIEHGERLAKSHISIR